MGWLLSISATISTRRYFATTYASGFRAYGVVGCSQRSRNIAGCHVLCPGTLQLSCSDRKTVWSTASHNRIVDFSHKEGLKGVVSFWTMCRQTSGSQLELGQCITAANAAYCEDLLINFLLRS
jgi:hypothetical protein